MLPETPRFLVKKGKDDKAIKSLTFLRRLPADHPALIQEFDEIKGSWEYEQSLGKASYPECFKGNIGKRTITGIALQSLQQLVGVVSLIWPPSPTIETYLLTYRQNFIFYYGTAYFASNPNSGLPSAFILQVITNVVNVLSTFPGLYAIDAFGRRFVLLTGAIGMGVSQYIVAACGAATGPNNQGSSAAQFSFICIYIFFFASTFGPGKSATLALDVTGLLTLLSQVPGSSPARSSRSRLVPSA